MPKELRLSTDLVRILLALARGTKHGYAILKEVSDPSAETPELGPSSLYYALGRLEQARLIETVPEPSEAVETEGGRRKFFAITDAGRERLASELEAMADLIGRARDLRFGI